MWASSSKQFLKSHWALMGGQFLLRPITKDHPCCEIFQNVLLPKQRQPLAAESYMKMLEWITIYRLVEIKSINISDENNIWSYKYSTRWLHSWQNYEDWTLHPAPFSSVPIHFFVVTNIESGPLVERVMEQVRKPGLQLERWHFHEITLFAFYFTI